MMMMVTIATIAAIVVVAVVAAIAILVAACRKDDWEDDPKSKSECDSCKWAFEDGDMEWFFGTYRKYWWKHCTDCMYWWREKQH